MKVCLATGSTPVPPPFPIFSSTGPEEDTRKGKGLRDKILMIRDRSSISALTRMFRGDVFSSSSAHRTIALIGNGGIALEVAHAFSEFVKK